MWVCVCVRERGRCSTTPAAEREGEGVSERWMEGGRESERESVVQPPQLLHTPHSSEEIIPKCSGVYLPRRPTSPLAGPRPRDGSPSEWDKIFSSGPPDLYHHKSLDPAGLQCKPRGLKNTIWSHSPSRSTASHAPPALRSRSNRLFYFPQFALELVRIRPRVVHMGRLARDVLVAPAWCRGRTGGPRPRLLLLLLLLSLLLSA